ncbi:MAG: Gfo/Idh/MocA family oxidoreductase [Candidatus Hydrogenedentota bacterium]
MKEISRRSFIKATAVGVGALAARRPFSKVLGANGDIRVGVVGFHGQGGNHIENFLAMPGVRLVALCDVDERVLNKMAHVLEKQNVKVAKYTDVRKLLENDEVDAISIATPNHWHSLITIWACQAGKDVYVEKPCSHNVYEGRKAVEAARKYKRIVQHGTQNRSSSDWARQIAAVQSGKYGKLLVSKGYCCKPRWSIRYKRIKEPPDPLHFDLWLGPAPEQPYHGNLVHYNWHWFWDTGNGDIGNQGVHEMDLARWAIKDATLPKSVVSMGGRWVNGRDFSDQGETPNMLLSVFDYGETLLVFETRGLVGKRFRRTYPRKVTVEFYLEEGVIRDGKFYPKGSDKPEPLIDVDPGIHPNGPFGNFIDCVRSRNQDELNADILKGHYSSALCHLGNISYRVGEEVPFEERPKVFTQNHIVSDSMETVLANTQALGVTPGRDTYRLGPKLAFDGETEQFVDNGRANELLTRDYRAPFVVPERV